MPAKKLAKAVTGPKLKTKPWSAARKLKFARLLFEGNMTQREAFIAALPQAKNWTKDSQNSNASTAAKRPEIVELVAKMRAETLAKVVDAGAISLEQHLTALADLRDRAAKAGDWSSAVRAEEDRGKAGGLYIERKQVDSRTLVTVVDRAVSEIDALMERALLAGGTEDGVSGDGASGSLLPAALPAEPPRH